MKVVRNVKCTGKCCIGNEVESEFYEKLRTGGFRAKSIVVCRGCGKIARLFQVMNPAESLMNELLLHPGQTVGGRSFLMSEAVAKAEEHGLQINDEGVVLCGLKELQKKRFLDLPWVSLFTGDISALIRDRDARYRKKVEADEEKKKARRRRKAGVKTAAR